MLKSLAVWAVALAGISALFSFSPYAGGDVFEVYLGNKLLIQQYVHRDKDVKSISLDGAASQEVLSVRYNHCGKSGIARSIQVKDLNNKVLKTWKYDDGQDISLACKVGDIQTLQKNNSGSRLNLVYASREIPNGKIVAAIVSDNDSKARLE